MKKSLLKIMRIALCAAAFVTCLQLQAQPDAAYGTFSISYYPGFGGTESYSGSISGVPSTASWSATGGPGNSVSSTGGGGIFDFFSPAIAGVGITSGTGVSQSAPSKGGFDPATLTISWNVYYDIGSAGFGYGSPLLDYFQLALGGNVGPAGSYVAAIGTGTFSDTSGTIAAQWGSKATVGVNFTDDTPGAFTQALFDGNYPLADLPANDLLNLTGSLMLTAYDPAGDSGIALLEGGGPIPAPEPASLAGATLTAAGGLFAYVMSRRRK